MTQTARTYGQALFDLARDEGIDEQVLMQLQLACGVLRDNPAYVTLLTLPSVSKAERCSILHESFHGQVHPYLLNFMKILVEQGTIAQLSGCEVQMRRLYHEEHGILEATAVTAKPLPSVLRAQLQEKLAAVTGKRVELDQRVDAQVLGGVRLEMDGTRLDGTVQLRLAQISARLREAAL